MKDIVKTYKEKKNEQFRNLPSEKDEEKMLTGIQEAIVLKFIDQTIDEIMSPVLRFREFPELESDDYDAGYERCRSEFFANLKDKIK